MDELSLEEFIYEVKRELLETQKKHEGEYGYFNLQQVELEVSVAVRRAGSGKVNIYVAEVGGDITKELTHVVKLIFDIAPFSDSGELPSTVKQPNKAKKSHPQDHRIRVGGKKYK